MSSDKLEVILKEIEVMASIESAVARLYSKCAKLFPENSDFWMQLSMEETGHARVLSELAVLMRKLPHEFHPGKTCAPEALQNFLSRINANFEKLDSPAIKERDALLMAYHMESTVIERNYTEIVRTDHWGYAEGLEVLAEASKVHRDKLLKRMQELK